MTSTVLTLARHHDGPPTASFRALDERRAARVRVCNLSPRPPDAVDSWDQVRCATTRVVQNRARSRSGHAPAPPTKSRSPRPRLPPTFPGAPASPASTTRGEGDVFVGARRLGSRSIWVCRTSPPRLGDISHAGHGVELIPNETSLEWNVGSRSEVAFPLDGLQKHCPTPVAIRAEVGTNARWHGLRDEARLRGVQNPGPGEVKSK